MEMTNVRIRLLVAMGVLLVGLLLLATQCPNGSSSLVLSASPTSGTSPLTVSFDVPSSLGPEGSVLMYDWVFGDGDTGTGKTISHTYRQPGIYTAQVTVTDDDGNMGSTSCEITVTAAVGTPPSAGFTATPSSGEVPLAVTFNASGSSDSDGSITSYAWSFGDGRNSSGVTTSHIYNSAGTYAAKLTVTDNAGSTDTATRTIQVSAAPAANNPPTASFTATPSSGEVPLAVTFNASGSSDSDGSITSYAWSFGDGGNSSGATAAHTYTAGTYTAQLTVTDNAGATDTTTTQIEVSASSVPEDLYVDANSGSDTAGDGTQSNPYRTITKAVGVASAGGIATCTIHVAAGIYNAVLGEETPIELVDGVNLVGAGTTCEDVKVALNLQCGTDCLVARIHCYAGIEVRASSKRVVLEDIIVTGTGSGMGVRIHAEVEARITNASVSDFLDGVFIGGAGASVTIERSTIESVIGIAVRWGATASVRENTIRHCSSGVYVLDNAVATMENNSILNNATGVLVLEEAKVALSENVISANVIGAQVGNTAIVDLGGGGLGSAGGNTIIGSSNCNINDERSAYSGPLFARNNTWDDPQPSEIVNGPIDSPPNCFIENEGNSIIFSD